MVFRGPLCPTCSAFPFDKDNPPVGLNDNSHPVLKLGTFDEVSRRACPLCSLVTLATTEIQRTEKLVVWGKDEVKISWLSINNQTGGFSLEYRMDAGKGWRAISRGTYLCFVRPKLEPPLKKLCNVFMPISESQIDFKRVRSWLAECEKTHDGCYNPQYQEGLLGDTFPGLQVLRLIDVQKSCLIETKSPTRYVTLSYVWGAVSSIRLSAANRDRLMQPGAIQTAWSLIPKTIQDAITTTRLVGERYLWVDALCLMQNDHKDLQLGTGVMDLIYEFSVLCIVAAGGKDANEGLPGIGVGSRRMSQAIAEVEEGLQLAVFTGHHYHLAGTVYNARAWTLQEQALSRRLIYFINDQVYFRCRHRGFSESMMDWEGISVDKLVPDTMFMAMKMNRRLLDLESILALYSRRTLTYQNDVGRAIAGIMRRFESKLQKKFIEGLPEHAIDRFLLFFRSHTSLRRRKGFPSYSWMGWIGPMDFSSLIHPFSKEHEFQLGTWLEECRWITWYKRSANGSEEIRSERQRPFSEFYSCELPFETSQTSPSERDDQVEKANIKLPSYSVLQFWTLSVFFKLSDVEVLRGSASLIDKDEQVCGELFMDGYDESTFFTEQEIFEFILLSIPKAKGVRIDNRVIPGKRSFFVMCVETCDGLTERRGIGWVVADALQNCFEPGLAWKEFLLA